MRSISATMRATLTLALFLAGCGGGPVGSSPEVDLARSLEQVQREAAAADERALEATLAAYEPALAAARKRFEAANERSTQLSPAQLLSPTGDAVKHELERARSDLSALERRLSIYARELEKRTE